MRIAIPIANGALAMHFGHCAAFALVDVDDDRAITATATAAAPPHQPGLLPRWLAEQGVDVVIAGGMGGRAQQLFREAGIEVLTGAPAEAPETLVRAYLDGALVTGANACDH
jgi:predicted Fe-Mo cluster-binding NifX family protein